MKAEQLWASILQEAIQGRLVPQLESEPEVNYIGEVPEDIPFAIPEKWKWAKLGDLVVFNPKVALDDKLEATFLPMAAVSAGYENKVNTKERRFWKKIKTGYSKFADGDIIMAKITPCFQNLKSAICRNLYNGVGAGSTEFHVIRPNSLLNPEYLLIFLKSPYLITYGIENFKGTAGQQRIGTTDLKKCFVPLPPLEEQRRIVACIQGLRSYIGSYQQEEQQLAILQSSFREKLRASILQEAIQGKLVPQLESEPEVETFSSEPDDPPFDIPDKWKWAKFRDVVDVRDGTHDTPKYQISGVPLVTSKNLRNGTIDFNNVKYISEEDHIEISKRSKVEKGDILFAMIGTVGNPAIVGNDSIFSIKNVALFKPLYDSKLNFEFLYYLLLFAQNQMIKESSGGVQRFVSLKYLRNFYIPVPPLGEQQRIVSRIKKLISTLEAL